MNALIVQVTGDRESIIKTLKMAYHMIARHGWTTAEWDDSNMSDLLHLINAMNYAQESEVPTPHGW